MPITRIYQQLEPEKARGQSSFYLDQRASHHLINVLRVKKGEPLTIFNGLGGEYTAHVSAIHHKKVQVTGLTFLSREVESPIEMVLGQSLMRGEKMDFIVQKSVELGVNKIIPMMTERCHFKLDAEREKKRLQHWRSVIISACEQCGRNRLPEILPVTSFQACLELPAEARFIFSPNAPNGMPQLRNQKSALLLIGPEGGFTDEEVAQAVNQKFNAIHLGPRILRTETAAIAAMSIFQYLLGNVRLE